MLNLKPNLLLTAILGLSTNQVMSAEWDYPNFGQQLASVEQVKTYLKQYYGDLGRFELRYQTASLLGYHYNFDIYQEGVYQAQKTLVVSTDKNHQITRVFRSDENTVMVNGKPFVAAELDQTRTLKAEFPPALQTGSLVETDIQVFDPDLRTMQQTEKPSGTWAQLEDYPNPIEYVSQKLSVLESKGKYYLANSRVQQVDAIALIEPNPTGGQAIENSATIMTPEGLAAFDSLKELASLSMDDPRFAQVMAYYHLDRSLAYVESLGFNLYQQPVRYDARGMFADNSVYYRDVQTTLLGIGGVTPDAFDGDVVVHELGHGLHYQIVPDWGYGHSGALGEGVGDYWAGSASYRQQYLDATRRGQEFELDTVFNWDGVFGHRRGTRSLWNQRAQYFEQAEYRAHVSVGGEIGNELWSTPLFQALKGAVVLYGDESDQVFREFDTVVLQGMYGLGRGLKMHDVAESTVYAAKTLYPEKEYARLLQEQFAARGLIKPPFVIKRSQRYLDDSKPMTLSLASTGRTSDLEATWRLGNQKGEQFQASQFSSHSWQQEVPIQAQCGQPLESQLEVSYQYSQHLSRHQWQGNEFLIKGTPRFNQEMKALNETLPDVTLSGTGGALNGKKIFIQSLGDRDAVIDDSFGLYLDIEHPSISDLEVVLTSPKGTRITLLSHRNDLGDGFKDYFTAQYDPALQTLIGEASWGTWRIEITDKSYPHSGILKAWHLGHFNHYQCTSDSSVTPSSGEGSSSGGSTTLASLLLMLVVMVRRKRFSLREPLRHKDN